MNILRIIKKGLKKFYLKKITAIITATSFIFSIISSQAVYAAIPITNSLPAPINLSNLSPTLIPFNLGRITDAYYSNSGDIIINIQDLHSHEQTQKNISSILSILDNKFGITDIYIEGATGILNTSWLSNIEDSNTKQKVLDILLKNGRLSGGELFAVKTGKDTILKGLEDKNLYSQNFNKLNDIYNKKVEIRNYLTILNNVFNEKSAQYFSEENKNINKIIKTYKEGKIKTNKYIELLLQKAQKANINLSKYKNFINFTQIVSKQNSFNQKALKKEINEILKELKEQTSFSEYKDLIEKSTKKELEVEFYFDLLNKAIKLNILSDKKHKNTILFFEYLKQNQNINTVNLANEEKMFIQELQDKLAQTQAEKDILFLQTNIESLSHYLTNKMTAKEYEIFSQNINKFKLLWKKYIDIDNLIDLTEYFNLVGDFYNNNIERNRVFIKNLLGKKPNKTDTVLRIKNSLIDHENKIIEELAKGKKIHVVITGGFHTYGFNKLLEEEKANYIVITPNITEETVKADFLYENIFKEQYDITNTTFANRPISEIIKILNKGEIKDIRIVGNNVEIEYVSKPGEPEKRDLLNQIQQPQEKQDGLIDETEAKLIAHIIVDIQRFKELRRMKLRTTSEETIKEIDEEISDLEKEILKGFSDIQDSEIRMAIGAKIRNEVWSPQATTKDIKSKKWYQKLTELGWISLREALVAILEQKYFDNIAEEARNQIINTNTSARELFLQGHEYYGEKENVTIQLNQAVTLVIKEMNKIYRRFLGYFGIPFIARLAAKIVGMKKHYHINMDRLSRNSDIVLTQGSHEYQVTIDVSFTINNMQINYNKVLSTHAPTKAKAFNNVVRNAAVDILRESGLDQDQFIYLAMSKIRAYLQGKDLDQIVKEVISTTAPKRTDKPFEMRDPNPGEYKFNIVIPGINDTPELAEFQTVYAVSPSKAIAELINQICDAIEKGQLKGGFFEKIAFSRENIGTIVALLSKKYSDSNLSEIIKNLRFSSAPVLNSGAEIQQENRQMKLGESVYTVFIPGINDREELKPYRTVVATDKRRAIEQAVLAIIKAKERKEIRGGYYKYIAINYGNIRIIVDEILNSNNFTISEYNETKQTTQQPTYLQTLISQLTNSKNDIELKAAIELMLNAGFKQDYVEKLLSQYLNLRNGNIPQEIYSKTAPIKFGTAGVRGIMGEEIDFLDIIIITQAISNVISEIASKQKINTKDIKILVGGDSRFLSKQFAEIVSKILAANGINVVISSDDIPSPAISYYTRKNKFTLSINITASHNPKEHNGYKITLGDGGQAGTDVTTMIENEIKSLQDKLTSNVNPIKVVKDSPRITHVDVKDNFIEDFIKMIRKMFAIDNDSAFSKFKEKAAQWTVVVDPKNGATKTYYYEILKFFGFNVVMINDSVDPTFGGQKPEPSFANTEQLRKKVPAVKQTAQGQNILGISTDVDGDRFAVVDENGNFITANDIGTILLNFRLKTLLDDLLSEIMAANGDIEKQNAILKKFVTKKDKKTGEEKDWKIIVPRNCATTHVIDDLAEKLVSQCYDRLKELNLDPQLLNKFKNTVEVKEVNVGFKFFAQAKHNAEDNGDLFLLGVESSGGISVAEWIYDKCGFLANLMLLFVLVGENKQPGEILNDIYSQISYEPQGLETAIRFREIVEKEGNLNTPEQISAEAKIRQEQLMSILAKLKQYENNEGIKNLFTSIDPGLKIKEIRTNDGIKIIFENGTWLLIRPSGTEPIVRIFDETKGDKALSQKLADFVMEKGGKELTDKIESILSTESKLLQTNMDLFKQIIINSIRTLQRLTYSFLFKDNMEYTIVANADDLARIKEAQILSNSGTKVNLVLVGGTTLIQETLSRLSTEKEELAFCLMAKLNENLTIYGYDNNSNVENSNTDNLTQQEALIAILNHINDNSKNAIKILDLPTELNYDIVIPEIEEQAKEKFSTVGVGKTVINLFSDALTKKIKQTDDMFIKPSLVASNLSSDKIDTFEQEDINRLKAQGVTTIIISIDDKLLQSKSVTLKNILQMAHDNGLKVMFSYSFDLKNMTIDSLEKWIASFNDKFQQFKENGGIDGFQADLSKCGELANTITVLLLFSKLAEIVNEQNIGSFLSMKMPENIYPTEYLIIFNKAGIKLVADYDSPLISIGKSVLNTENMIINISADKNGAISISQLSNIFENNKVSMLSFDLPILEAIDTTDGFSFNGMTITKFISSIFETTPEGQNIRGINNGRNFVMDRDIVIDENNLNILYSMYISDNFDINQIKEILNTNFKENISKYELKGFIEGFLEALELKKIHATDISFDKKEYSNLLMKSLFEYRVYNNVSFDENIINEDIEKILNIDNFRADFKPKIEEVFNILNGRFENKVDSVIYILSTLKDNPELNEQERTMVLEGLLSLLLGYAKQDHLNMDKITSDQTIANIKAILKAA